MSSELHKSRSDVSRQKLRMPSMTIICLFWCQGCTCIAKSCRILFHLSCCPQLRGCYFLPCLFLPSVDFLFYPIFLQVPAPLSLYVSRLKVEYNNNLSFLSLGTGHYLCGGGGQFYFARGLIYKKYRNYLTFNVALFVYLKLQYTFVEMFL